MRDKLTDRTIKSLPTPATGNRIHYDSEVPGFGCRVTAGGARSFILNYRTRTGRERRYTIGDFSVTGDGWSTSTARGEAERLRVAIRGGADPMEEIEADRNAKTVADLVQRFEEEHLPRKRAHTADSYGIVLARHVLPELRNRTVAELRYTDIADLHRKVTRTSGPYQANKVLAVLSKMFALAVQWGWRPDNPVKGIERNPEVARHRYLSPAELVKLTEALNELPDQQAANILRLLLLTGARKSEVLAARWDQLDLAEGIWTKPGSTTKQKTLHRVPLSAPARQLLVDVHAQAEAKAKAEGVSMGDYVFPGRGSAHRIDIKDAWLAACIASGIVTVTKTKDRTIVKASARIHDLRHTYASVLASAGLSLPIIGALLGHSQPVTTARYAHLMDDPLRQATERVGAIVMTGREGGDVVALRGGR